MLVYERKNGHVTPEISRYVERCRRRVFTSLPSRIPELGIKKLDTHRSPVIGPRLIGTSADGTRQAVLTIVSAERDLPVEDDADRGRPDPGVGRRPNGPPARSGLELAVTGSAVVGHDTNTAASESIANTTYSTIALVVADLAGRLSIAAAGDGPAGHDRAVGVRLAAADRAVDHGARSRVSGHQHHPGLRHRRPLRRGDRLLPVPDRALFRGAGPRHGRAIDALREAIGQVGAALVASAGTVIVGLGMLYFSSFAKIKYTGPTIALSLAVALLAALTLAPALLVCLARGDLLAVPRPASPEAGADREAESLRGARRSRGSGSGSPTWSSSYPLAILAVCLVVLAPLAVVGARTKSNYNQLADLDPDRPSVIGANVVRRYFAVGELSPASPWSTIPGSISGRRRGATAIDEISRRLQAIDNVAEVRSLDPAARQAAATGSRRRLSRAASPARP